MKIEHSVQMSLILPIFPSCYCLWKTAGRRRRESKAAARPFKIKFVCILSALRAINLKKRVIFLDPFSDCEAEI